MSAERPEVILINPLPMPSRMLGASLGMPYGPLYLAESLLRNGYTPHIVCADVEEAVTEVDRRITPRTLCVGISTMSGTQLTHAVAIARRLRPRYPGLPLVWGVS